MAKTFFQLADEAMAQAHTVSAEEALQELKRDSNALLVDVRDESEVTATGLGVGAINAPGRSLAWKADLEVPVADSRSPASSSERQLWRKQNLKLDISTAISDPI